MFRIQLLGRDVLGTQTPGCLIYLFCYHGLVFKAITITVFFLIIVLVHVEYRKVRKHS